jgi:hypothetical protein
MQWKAMGGWESESSWGGGAGWLGLHPFLPPSHGWMPVGSMGNLPSEARDEEG